MACFGLEHPALLSPDAQLAFNKAKGSAPVRTDLSTSSLGAYQQAAVKTMQLICARHCGLLKVISFCMPLFLKRFRASQKAMILLLTARIISQLSLVT